MNAKRGDEAPVVRCGLSTMLRGYGRQVMVTVNFYFYARERLMKKLVSLPSSLGLLMNCMRYWPSIQHRFARLGRDDREQDTSQVGISSHTS
eukprot:scaffold15824_cov56-Cyclotella_meneghiniana.AAC.2